MPTPSEKKALTFVAIVVLLGGAVRVVRAGSSPQSSFVEQQALARQATAADSAASAGKRKKARKTSGRSKRDTIPRVVGGVASVPPSFARPDAPDSHTPYGSRSEQLGFPPPGPRIDVGGAQRAATPGNARGKIDVDRASAQEIEALPRIGPALAKRIVANRDSHGPFRSLEA
ncbi:MAG: helix-hairpin-helix domain-containing protein, partial [Gemmatimonadaceae bacterium]